MILKESTILAISILICRCSIAGFVGFPLAEQSKTSFYALQEDYHPVAQIYSGIVERCLVVGIDPPHIVKSLSYSVAPGSNATVTVTNQFWPVVVDGVTVYPTIDNTTLAILDDAIMDLIPRFVPQDPTPFTTNWFAPGKMLPGGDRFLLSRYVTNLNAVDLFDDLGVGNTVGNVARWTRSPSRLYHQVIYEQHWDGATWVTTQNNAMEWYDRVSAAATNEPNSHISNNDINTVYRYGPSNVAPFMVYSDFIDTLGIARSEGTTVGNPTLHPVKEITSLPYVHKFSSATGAWWRLETTNVVTIYGDRPARLYATDLDERWSVLNALRYTYPHDGDIGYSNRVGYQATSGIRSKNSVTWSDLEADVEADWSVFDGGVNIIAENYKATISGLFDYKILSGARAAWADIAVSGLDTNLPKTIKFYYYATQTTDGYLGGDNNTISITPLGSGISYDNWVLHSTVSAASNESYVVSATFPPSSPGTFPSPWVPPPPAPPPSWQNIYIMAGSILIAPIIEWDFQY